MKLRDYINAGRKGPAYINGHEIVDVGQMYRPRFSSGRNTAPVVDVLVKLSAARAEMTHFNYVGLSVDITIGTTPNPGPDLGPGEAD